MDKVKAVLLDIEGTLYSNGTWLPNAIEVIQWLIANNILFRFVTNKTTIPRKSIGQIFHQDELDIPDALIIKPAYSANKWFQDKSTERGVFALVHPEIIVDLANINIVNHSDVDYVIVGNMDDRWTIEGLNMALRALENGAILTSLEMNKYWLAQDGLRLLAGPFVKALEYASGSKCEIVFGKPSSLLFHAILDELNLHPSNVLMVGDDLEADIIGARALDMQALLVKTGSFSESRSHIDWKQAEISAVENIAELPQFISKMNR